MVFHITIKWGSSLEVFLCVVARPLKGKGEPSLEFEFEILKPDWNLPRQKIKWHLISSLLVTWIPLHLTRKWINEEFLNSSTYILGHNSVFLPNKRSRFCFLPGLHDSVIVGSNKNYLTSLSNWLAPVAKSVNSLWKRCWRASVDGWAASTFHSQCDGKGPTVTIIRVGRYIFGGYTSKSWRKCAL